MRVKLTGINTVRRKLADGTIRTHYYHRATGTKLQGEPGSAEFVASFHDAGRAAALNRSQGTVEWLIRQYQASRAWTKKLSDKTRANEEFNIRACEAKWGKTPLQIVENPKSRPPFLKWHEQLAEDHPRAADAKLARLAKVFAWGVDHGHIRHNPIASFERAYSSTRAEIIWLPEHVKAFAAAAKPEMRLAMMLALHTGQRQGDLLKLTWSAWDGNAITLKQGKSKRTVYVPATRALKSALDAAPRRASTILVAARGGPWLKRRFHEVWSETFAAARITDSLHFHDLRGTAVTMLAEAGCNVPEIATITGHSQTHAQKILDQYLARTRSLAESAIAKLDEHARNRQKPDSPANSSANGEKGDEQKMS